MRTKKMIKPSLLLCTWLLTSFVSISQEKLKSYVHLDVYEAEHRIDSVVFSTIGLGTIDQVECNLLRLGNGTRIGEYETGTNILPHKDGVQPSLPFHWATGKYYYSETVNGVGNGEAKNQMLVQTKEQDVRKVAYGGLVYSFYESGDTSRMELSAHGQAVSNELIEIQNDQNQLGYSVSLNNGDTIVTDSYQYLGDQLINHVRTYENAEVNGEKLRVFNYYEYYGDQLAYTSSRHNGFFGEVKIERYYHYDSLNRVVRIDQTRTEASWQSTNENEYVYFIDYGDLSADILYYYYPENEPGILMSHSVLTYYKPGYLSSVATYSSYGSGELTLSSADRYYYESQSGNNEFETEKLVAFPNPVNDVFRIFPARPNADYTLLDVNGKEVMKTSNVDRIDLSSFSPGIYLLKVQTGGEIETISISKK